MISKFYLLNIGLVFLFIETISVNIGAKNSDNYGPYDVEYPNVSTCKGPKAHNHATYSLKTVLRDGNYIVTINMSFMEPARREEGPYDVEYPNVSTCKGPKAHNHATYSLKTVLRDGNYIVTINMSFMEPARREEARIVVYNTKDNKKTLLLDYRVKKPCEHFFIAGTIKQIFKAPKCLINKGNYVFETNFSEYTRQFYGTSFFYGEYLVKTYGISAKGNVICLYFNMIIKKKN